MEHQKHTALSFLTMCFSSLVLRTNSIRWSLKNVLGGQKTWKTIRVDSQGISVSALCLQDFMASDSQIHPWKRPFSLKKWKMPCVWKLLLFEEDSWACVFLESQSQLCVCWTAPHPSRLCVQAGHWWQTRTTPAEHTRVLAPDQELIPPWKCTMTKHPAFQKGLSHSTGLGHMDIIKAAWGALRGPKAAYLSQCLASTTFTSETFAPLSSC